MKTPTVKSLVLVAILFVGYSFPIQANLIQETESGEARLLGHTGVLKEKIIDKRFDKGINPLQQVFNLLNVVIPLEPLFTFEGMDVNDAGGMPSANPNGDVSPDHYIQMTNHISGSIFQVFNKEGFVVYGPVSLNVFWDQFGIIGGGDPIVLWDQGAERWLISELGEYGTDKMLLAVSESSDPLGNWFAYEFQAPFELQSPRYGIWPNAYFVTTIENDDPDHPIYALDREAMLNGAVTANMQRLNIPKFETSTAAAFQTMSPVDWDGAANPPPVGSPQPILRMYDNAWDGGVDKLEIWEIDIDWDDSNNTTVTGPIDLFTEAFDSDVCNGTIFNCLSQSNGSTLSASMQTLMHRVNYRNFGTHESIVLNHVVDVDGNNHAGVKWYELRKYTGGQWEIYQEGIFSPDDNHRFMASIAIDIAGDIGLAYSIMGQDKHLSLAFTGRRVDDPLGEMTIDEYEFASGLSFLNGFRWGDYSMMSVDETDGATFWFTGEYMKENAEWGTKVVTFLLKEDSLDLGPTSIITPVTSPYLTENEVVEVYIKNFGLAPQSDFKVGLIIDDNFIIESTFSDTLHSDSLAKVVFNTTINMASVGDYHFKIYTNLLDDANPSNDTLRSVISQLPRFDASVSNFINIESTVCDSTLDLGIVITNEGAEILETVTIQWSSNAGPLMEEMWAGNLEMGDSDTIYVNVESLISGTNLISANTINPNGMGDENTDNDQLSKPFEVVTDGNGVDLYLLSDFHADETTWNLKNSAGTIIYEGGPYGASYTAYIEPWCLLEDCYTFTIFDSFGDGLSNGIPGTFQITDEEGHILTFLAEPDFGEMTSKTFCSPFVCMLEGVPNLIMESYPNAFDGIISITATNGTPPFQYSIDGGDTFQDEPIFTGLGGNTYNVVVMDINGCISETEVILETCTLQFSVIVTNTTSNNMDGSIEINAQDGVPPLIYSIDNGQTTTTQEDNFFSGLDEGIYTVLVTDSIGCSFTISDVTINSMPLGTEENLLGISIEIIPNPTKDYFRLDIKGIQDAEPLEVELLDIYGQIIQSAKLSRNNDSHSGLLSLSPFPIGVYFVRVKHPRLNRVMKVVRM